MLEFLIWLSTRFSSPDRSFVLNAKADVKDSTGKLKVARLRDEFTLGDGTEGNIAFGIFQRLEQSDSEEEVQRILSSLGVWDDSFGLFCGEFLHFPSSEPLIISQSGRPARQYLLRIGRGCLVEPAFKFIRRPFAHGSVGYRSVLRCRRAGGQRRERGQEIKKPSRGDCTNAGKLTPAICAAIRISVYPVTTDRLD